MRISSQIARNFSARIDVADPPQSLFLVAGKSGAPDTAVRSVDAKVVTRLGNRTVLAVGQFSALRLLNSHPAIETAGPINIDSERFAQFVAIAKRRHHASR